MSLVETKPPRRFKKSDLKNGVSIRSSPQSEAVHSVYIIKCCPNKAVAEMTPEEAFTSHKPVVSRLRVFGSSELQLSPSSRNTSYSKAYRLWDPQTKCLSISRDIHFLEPQSNNSRIIPKLVLQVPASCLHWLYHFVFN